MRKELNVNNSKKIIMGVSILFCTVILIVGTTLAYFTQSGSETTGNIVSSNDNNTYINYIDDKSFMLDNIIPIKSNDITNALFSNNICVDNNGHNVCGAYMFTLQSSYKEVQKINISMIPTANSFTNLKYMMFKVIDFASREVEIITENPISLEKNNLNPISLVENEILYSNEIATYAVVFFVESKDYDQTSEDAGKNFGASIRIDSLTTGKYIINSFGDNCWDLELLDRKIDEYKLIKFKGINSDGTIKEECENIYVTQDDDGYYTINVPSFVGGKKITTLGGKLFVTIDEETFKSSMLKNVKQYNIEEGITTIDDGDEIVIQNKVSLTGTFAVAGIDADSNQITIEEGVTINLPNSLTKIGDYAFLASNLNNMVIPSSVNIIGKSFFSIAQVKSLVIPKISSVKSESFGMSLINNLTLSGDLNYSFNSGTNEGIFEYAQINNLVLEEGITNINDNLFNNASIMSGSDKTLIIPKSVKNIGNNAFKTIQDDRISKLSFAGAEDGTSSLESIGEYAFENCFLDYNGETEDDYLIIPSSVKTIGIGAFKGNSSLKFIRFNGTRQQLDLLGTDWYSSEVTIKAYGE